MRLRVLFVASECSPLMKTGGLGDAVAGLARALRRTGHDLRVLMPAYADTLAGLEASPEVAQYRPPPGLAGTRLLGTCLPPGEVPVWLFDMPGFSDRPGNPYSDDSSGSAAGIHLRFGALCRAAVAIAGGGALPGWRADLIHCHDWHTGLVPVYALLERVAAATVFTVHNLGYQGLFPFAALEQLQLPPWLWHYRALEYHGDLSFIKGGLCFADYLTTVSPGYAREILTPAYGEGLDGVLRERQGALAGILNGLDTAIWDPRRDPCLSARYSPARIAGKRRCREALCDEMGLEGRGQPVVAVIGRLAHQKGTDLLIEALPVLMTKPLRLVVLGSGEPEYEKILKEAQAHWPGRLAVHIGHDEALAHRMIAAADMVLMPSRFEPCGLVQMQALRYGTVPVVRRSGGLADTVIDATAENLDGGTATGLCFDEPSARAIIGALHRALALYRDRKTWRALRRRGMEQNFRWDDSAESYDRLYRQVLSERGAISSGPLSPPSGPDDARTSPIDTLP
jgi:starch synthase